MSEALDRTMKSSEGDLDSGLNTVSNSENMSVNSDEPGLYHLDKKVKLMHAPNSSLEVSSNNTNRADSNMMNSSIYSRDTKAATILRSSQSRMYPEEHSAGHQTTTAPKEYVAKMLHGMSDYETSDDGSPSPSASAPFHANYRKCGPDLMTLHMFTGEMNGKTPKYVPVYERNSCGKLLKLVKSRSGHWDYMELEKLTEEEEEAGLKIFKAAEVVLQSSEPKKAVGRRTLADFGLPETKSKGGWGWL